LTWNRKGFKLTLDAISTEVPVLDGIAVKEAQNAMAILSLGGTTLDGYNLVVLFRYFFFYGANVGFRAWVSFMVEMRSYGTIINALWYVG
jgi:hypothetical protein